MPLFLKQYAIFSVVVSIVFENFEGQKSFWGCPLPLPEAPVSSRNKLLLG